MPFKIQKLLTSLGLIGQKCNSGSAINTQYKPTNPWGLLAELEDKYNALFCGLSMPNCNKYESELMVRVYFNCYALVFMNFWGNGFAHGVADRFVERIVNDIWWRVMPPSPRGLPPDIATNMDNFIEKMQNIMIDSLMEDISNSIGQEIDQDTDPHHIIELAKTRYDKILLNSLVNITVNAFQETSPSRTNIAKVLGDCFLLARMTGEMIAKEFS